MQAQAPVFLAPRQIDEERPGRCDEGAPDAIAQMRAEVAERGGRITHVDEGADTQLFGEVMNVLHAGNRHGRRAIGGVAAPDADAVVLVAAYRARAADAVAEILRQPIGLRPHLAHLAAHGKHVARPDGEPLLPTQACAVERLALVERDTRAQPDIDEIALTRVVLGIDVAAQPLPRSYQRGYLEIFRAVDARAIVRSHQRPLGFELDTAVAGRLALLAALPADAIAPVVNAFDIGMVEQYAHTVLVATARGRQVNVEKGALPMPVQAHAGFHRHGQARNDVLTKQRLGTRPVVTVDPQRRREPARGRFGHLYAYGKLDLAVGQLAAVGTRRVERDEGAAKEAGGLQRLLPLVEPFLIVRLTLPIANVPFDKAGRHAAQAQHLERTEPHTRPAVDFNRQVGARRLGFDGGLRMRDTGEVEVARVDLVEQGRFGAAPFAVDEYLTRFERPGFARLAHPAFELGPGNLTGKGEIDVAHFGARAGLDDDVPGFARVVFTHFQRHHGRKVPLRFKGRDGGVVSAPSQAVDLAAVLVFSQPGDGLDGRVDGSQCCGRHAARVDNHFGARSRPCRV